jgi:hypothetical protein
MTEIMRGINMAIFIKTAKYRQIRLKGCLWLFSYLALLLNETRRLSK